MRDQKTKDPKGGKAKSPKNSSNQISFLKNFIRNKITRPTKKSPTKKRDDRKDQVLSPSQALNLTGIASEANHFEVNTDGLTGRRSNDLLDDVNVKGPVTDRE